MRKNGARLCLAITALHLLCSVIWVAPARAETTQVPQLIRLHVMANSESLADQRMKLTVRDELLAVMNSLLATVGSMAEAEEVIKANLGMLAETVEAALEQADVDYTAQLQFGLFSFPAKYYGMTTLPAGRYTSLNVTLGEGAGRNWWCIVFPAMCFTAGVCEQVAEPETAQTLQLRSKIVELVGRFFAWCGSLNS